MYECKQNGEDFFSSLVVTYSRFGNCPANGLVTEQPQYSVAVCIFSTLQNTEISLIPNGLRLIFTCSLSLALPCIFHCFRHSYAVIQISLGTDIYTVSKMLTHKNVSTTQIYADLVNSKKRETANKISLK
ncbi:tyrosine-type recombinase/integrase [Phocaeicola dorei]|nr:tyrosine-type recombinase/integrase [Phocaeicola dorei]